MLNEQNRQQFLQKIAAQLQRPIRYQAKQMAIPVNNYPATRLTDLTQNQLCEEFIAFASQTQRVECVLSPVSAITEQLLTLCNRYGGGPIMMSSDNRLLALNLLPALQQQYVTYIWDPMAGSHNITTTERAKIGIVYAEAALAESGTVVVYSSLEQGRSISLLPETVITLVRKSTLLPRMTQLTEQLNDMTQQGLRMPSCVNLISGPSSTADIELIKVFGVHGPVHAVYLIIEDY